MGRGHDGRDRDMARPRRRRATSPALPKLPAGTARQPVDRGPLKLSAAENIRRGDGVRRHGGAAADPDGTNADPAHCARDPSIVRTSNYPVEISTRARRGTMLLAGPIVLEQEPIGLVPSGTPAVDCTVRPVPRAGAEHAAGDRVVGPIFSYRAVLRTRHSTSRARGPRRTTRARAPYASTACSSGTGSARGEGSFRRPRV